MENMMEVETLRDVIHWTKDVHLQLSECLSKCKKDNEDERAKMVLSYLSSYEKKLAKVFQSFEEKGDERALNTWCIEYINKFKRHNGGFSDEPFVGLNAQQVVATVVESHEYLMSLFNFLSMQAATASTKELMEEISSFEEHETMKMVQATNRFEDM
jgi:hypothetical protein